MTHRNNVTISWATDPTSVVVDAELDTNHPSGHGGTGKTAKGWVSETEPEEWENFNIKLREDRQRSILQNGRIPWDASVNYKLNAVTYLSGTYYISVLSPNLNQSPVAIGNVYWSPCEFSSLAGHTATINSMKSMYSLHVPPGQNSHNDTITDPSIGGNTKTAIDAQLKVVVDAETQHIARLDNPHGDTAVSVGTIPSTGGSFTGRVNYRSGFMLGTDSQLMSNATTLVAFRNTAGAIGLGIPDYDRGGRWQRILTVANFTAVNSLYTPTFTMPKADLHFPLLNTLSQQGSVIATLSLTRSSTLAYTDRSNIAQTAAVNTPAFEVAGLKLAVGTVLAVTAPNLFRCRDGCISYTLNNVVVVKDVQFTSQDLVYYFGNVGNVKNFRVWSTRLTPRQKLRIPR